MRAIGFMLLCSGCLDIPEPVDPDVPCDEDGDGYLAAACASALPSDCDDDSDQIHPGVREVCGDGVDQDCAGGDLPCASEIGGLEIAVGAEIAISGDRFRIALDEAEGYALTRLAADGPGSTGNNLMFADDTSLTLRERLAGVVLWDYAFSYDALAPTLAITHSGPAGFRAEVEWAAGVLAGTTRTTIFPDGRILRDDDFLLTGLGGVSCSPGAECWMTSYLSLDAGEITRVEIDSTGATRDIPGAVPSPPSEFFHEGTGSGPEVLCAHNGGDRVGFGYRFAAGSEAVVGLRATETVEADQRLVALQADWARQVTTNPGVGSYGGTALVHVGAVSSPEPCDSLGPIAGAFFSPPAMSITTGSAATGDGEHRDDDGDGYFEGSGLYRVRAAGAAVELELDGAAAPTTAIEVSGLTPLRLPVVRLDGVQLEHGRDYLAQIDGEAVLVFLTVAVGGGATLRIDVPAS